MKKDIEITSKLNGLKGGGIAMKKYLVTYENERGEIFEDEIEAESRKDARELANDSIWDMGGSVIRVDEIEKDDIHDC